MMIPTMPSVSNSTMAQLQNRWEHRLRRAQELQDRYPAAADPLRFYEIVLGFQHDVSRELTQQIRLETALREQLDLSFLTSKSPAILNLAIEHGPGHLREKAQSIHAAGEPALREMLESAIVNDAKLDSSARFLAFAIFQPVVEDLQL